jgi:ABC-type Fe3+-hydroxamate transport system substrate-binding protein
MISLQDQLGRTLSLPLPARRIVSVVPSQTELLSELGLDEEVVGITKFCVHPAGWLQSKRRVGGTKKLDTAIIRSLHPDLILANKEENTRAQLEELMAEFPVWISDIRTLPEAADMIRSVGMATGREGRAASLAAGIRERFAALAAGYVQPGTRPKACYLIWHRPWMAAGGGTFIHEMMGYCGLENVLGHLPRYPAVRPEQLQACRPEVVLLSSEPFPFAEKHAAEMRLILPDAKILLVDGEMFSWYGSRLLDAPAYLQKTAGLVREALESGKESA